MTLYLAVTAAPSNGGKSMLQRSTFSIELFGFPLVYASTYAVATSIECERALRGEASRYNSRVNGNPSLAMAHTCPHDQTIEFPNTITRDVLHGGVINWSRVNVYGPLASARHRDGRPQRAEPDRDPSSAVPLMSSLDLSGQKWQVSKPAADTNANLTARQPIRRK